MKGDDMTHEKAKTAEQNPVQPIQGKKGAPITGPTNPAREAESRDRLAPPSTNINDCSMPS